MLTLYRHKKRGSVYELVGVGQLQASDISLLKDDAPMTIYEDETGKLWVRHRDEFLDGRFEEIKEKECLPGSSICRPVVGLKLYFIILKDLGSHVLHALRVWIETGLSRLKTFISSLVKH